MHSFVLMLRWSHWLNNSLIMLGKLRQSQSNTDDSEKSSYKVFPFSDCRDWALIIKVNIIGSTFCSRSCLPCMFSVYHVSVVGYSTYPLKESVDAVCQMKLIIWHLRNLLPSFSGALFTWQICANTSPRGHQSSGHVYKT